MSSIRAFLTELDKYELAYFAKFKLLTYTEGTQIKIREYLAEQNIDHSTIDTLISENPKSKLDDGNERCTRCYSDKIRKDKVTWTATANKFGLSDEIATIDGIAGKATYAYEVICNVCGVWLSDPNQEKEKSIWEKIWNKIPYNPFNT